ncbi:MAG TPA: glycosyltransferase family 4 protein [Thermoanaerobaculia bacterium]|nr:glycosyltransferase family 4 protein [Thermoanaerobaculia bacterium]
MTRVLLLCPEPLGHRHPAGVGIRFLEIARLLVSDGHDVTVLSPDAGQVSDCRSGDLSPESIHLAAGNSEAVVAQGHVVNEWMAHGSPDVPLVVDLYDPYIVEHLHYYSSRGSEVFNHDHDTMVRSLLNGDFFLCASESQRLYYAGWLLATGRLNPAVFDRDEQLSSLIAVAPFGVPPLRTPPDKSAVAPAILFGGIYDWYEPRVAVDAIAAARREIDGLSLTFIHHPNAAMTPQDLAGQTMRYVKEKSFDGFVHFEPWSPYDQRAGFYDRFTAALLTFPQSLETDLSLRTRVLDYLWAGIPVVTSSARGTDQILRQYDAGMIINSLDPSEYASAIISLIRDDHRRETMITSSQRFVADHQWERVLEPLLSFCRKPRIDKLKSLFRGDLPSVRKPQSLLHRVKRRIRRVR